jgi:hypothetical protein
MRKETWIPWAASILSTLLHGCCSGGFCSEPDIVRSDLYHRRVTAGADQLHLVEMDCREGDAEACLALGRVFENGIDVPASQERAFEAFRSACALDQKHCYAKEELERAAASLRASEDACAAGESARACGQAARMYAEGRIAPRDPVRARALYERACPADKGAEGGGSGCSNLFAYMLLTGWGGPKDERRALGLVAHGSPYEAFAVELGLGVPKDLPLARARYESMCNHPSAANVVRGSWPHPESSEPFSCYRLAVMFEEGRGAPRDPAVSARLFYRACMQSTDRVVMQLACARGALLFLRNDVDPFSADWSGIRGVPVLHARRMLEQGCYAGNHAACRVLRQVRGVLGDAVIVMAPQ